MLIPATLIGLSSTVSLEIMLICRRHIFGLAGAWPHLTTVLIGQVILYENRKLGPFPFACVALRNAEN